MKQGGEGETKRGGRGERRSEGGGVGRGEERGDGREEARKGHVCQEAEGKGLRNCKEMGVAWRRGVARGCMRGGALERDRGETGRGMERGTREGKEGWRERK